jgi:hypothetical protein
LQLKKLNKTIFPAAIVCFCLGIFSLHQGQDWGDDFAVYISESKAIIDGSLPQLYQANKFITDHSETVFGPYLYPVGFPLLLVPVYKLFGLNFIAMKVYLLLFLPASVIIFYFILKKIFPQNPFLVSAATWVMAINYNYLSFVNNITSDIPFMFFFLLTVYQMIRSFSNAILKGVVVGCLCFFSFLIRDAGIVLLFSLFILQICRRYITGKPRGPKILVMILPYVVFASLFLITTLALPHGNKNLFPLLERITPQTAFWNLIYYFYMAGSFFMTYSSFIPWWLFCVAAAITIAFITAGFLYHLKNDRNNRFINFFIVGILMIYVLWPFRGGFRFLFPVFPFLIFFLFRGIEIFFSRLKMDKKIIIAILLLNTFWGIKQAVYNFRHNNNSSYTEEMKSIYDYIKQHTGNDKVIAFFKPRALYFFTGRLSVYIKNPVANLNPAVQYALVRKQQFNASGHPVILETKNFLLLDMEHGK